MLREDQILLTDKQRECVNYPANKNILVRGIAGSGKSLVIIRRAKKLCDQAMERGLKPNIVIYTYVNTLVEFMNEVITYGGKYADRIQIKTLDSEIQDIYKQVFNKNRLFNVYTSKNKMLDILKEITTKMQKSSSNRFFKDAMQDFLLDELMWMKQHMFTEGEEYLACVRKGRGKIRVSRQDRNLIFDVYEQFYKEMNKSCMYDFDLLCERLYKEKDKIPNTCKYDYVLIDEAQDLSLNKLLIAKELSRSSLTIAADFCQKIYNSGFTWKEIGISFKGQASKKLTSTHRNTYEIVALANSLSEKNTELSSMDEDDAYARPVMPERRGEKSVLRYTTTWSSEGKEIRELVKQIRAGNKDFTIGVLVLDKNSMNTVESWFDGMEYQKIAKYCDYKVLKPGLKLVTYHSAKGLEFDVVILPMLDDGLFPRKGRNQDLSTEALEDLKNNAINLLYVGMTRARIKLFMFAGKSNSRKPSPLLEELDTNYLEIIK